MAESYSVKAILSATDKGFSSTLRNAMGMADSFGAKLKSGFNFGILTGMGQQAFSMISNGISGMVSEIDSSNAAWKTFEGNMGILGKSKKEINGAKKELQAFAEQTVYSSSDMATTFAQLEAVGTKNTTQLVKGFGGLAAAAENPQQAMKTLSQQATQMAAKPNVAWQDFKLMLEQTPAGMAAVAKEMGMTSAELVKAIQADEVATEDFFDAINKVGNSDGFSKLATQYKTVGQAADGLKETIGNKLTPAFDVLSQVGINALSGIADKIGKIDGQAIANKVSGWVKEAKPYWAAFSKAASKVGGVISGLVAKAAPLLSKLREKMGGAIMSFLDKVGSIDVNAIVEKVTGWAKKAQPYLDLIVTAVTAVSNAFKAAWPYIQQFASALGGYLLNNAESICNTIKTLTPWVLGAVAAFKGFKFIKAVVPGMASFAKSIGSMVAGGIKSLGAKLFGVAAGQKAAGAAAASSSSQMLAAAKSFLMIGAGVLMVAGGIALLAQSAIALAGAGGGAIAVMAGLVVALVALGAGMAILLKVLAPMGAQLMPVATSMLVMGAAVLVVAAGFALLAAVSIQLANSGGLAIGVMAGLVLALAGLMALAAALGPAMTAGAVGFIAFGAAIALVGAGAVLAAAAMAILAGVLPTIVAYGLQGATAIVALGGAMTVFAAGATLAGAAAVVLGAGLIVATAGIVAFGAAMLVGAAGTLAMSAALSGVKSQMKSIASSAKTAENSLDDMRGTVKVVESGLDALGSKAKNAMQKVTSAFDSTASKAKSSGQKVGDGFKTGLQSGLNTAPNVAKTAVVSVAAALSSGYSSAYSAGAYISQGFAAGMYSQLGAIQSAAAQMAAAADAAVRAKARIHSPSKVSAGLGSYWGEGFVNGIADMTRDAWRAAENLVSIPSVATPRLAMAYGGELSSDYSYSNSSEYLIEVPLSVDGREFAKATVSYSQAELNKREQRDSRKHGKV